MTRAGSFLLLPLLAFAACQTQRKPLTGFTAPPPGSFLLDSTNPANGAVVLWPIFDLPPNQSEGETFLTQLSGQDTAVGISDEGFDDYSYSQLTLEGWTGGYTYWINGVPPGTYTVGIVDGDGQTWGQSAPLAIPGGDDGLFDSSSQLPAVIFTHFGGQMGSWLVDPSTQDSDPTTDQITVTNLVAEDVAVERCLITGGTQTSCTPVGTIASGADLSTVETLAAVPASDYQALIIYLASDPSQSYQRDLLQGTGGVSFGTNCEVERIIVHGVLPVSAQIQSGTGAFAMSSCYGYGSGAN